MESLQFQFAVFIYLTSFFFHLAILGLGQAGERPHEVTGNVLDPSAFRGQPNLSLF